MNTKIITLDKLQVGNVTVRVGNDGDIVESVVAIEKRGRYYFYTVECGDKNYTMSDRGDKLIRIVL